MQWFDWAFFHLISLPVKNDGKKKTETLVEQLCADSLKNSSSSHCDFSFLFWIKYFCVCTWSRSVKSIKKDGDYCKSGSERTFSPWLTRETHYSLMRCFPLFQASNLILTKKKKKENGLGYKIIFHTLSKLRDEKGDKKLIFIVT